MNREEFVYNIFRTGQGDHAEEIIKMIYLADDRTSQFMEDLMDAAYRYICVSTDYQKLYGFLLECDNMNRNYCISWDDAVKLICGLISIWGR